MPVIVQIFVIFAVCTLGVGLAALMPIAFPASVMSMLLLLVLMVTKVMKPKTIQQTGNFLLDNMPMFFIPVCVSVIEYWDVVANSIWSIVLISFLTTPLVFFVTGHVAQLAIRIIRRRKEKKQ